MKKSLLFVDDDKNILEGLRRVLRSRREAWDMHFAGSGAEALAIMETLPIDIVISDINMPGMDGIRLLENVMDRFPSTIRMILSGQSDADLIMKSVAVTHQFLSKPCDPDILKAVIAQTEESKTFLQNENLKNLVSKLGALPSIPTLFREISDELQSPEASINKVGDLISRDPSIAAKILQLANSAFFGRRRNVSKITEAVSYLGMSRIAELLLALHVFAQFKPTISAAFSMEELWTHSNSTAMTAKRIAEKQHASSKIADDSFTAGLLHDIGKLVLASRLPEEYEKTVLRAIADKIPLWLAERETFSATHAEVGAYLLAIWGLPNPIVDAAGYHHNPTAASTQDFSALTAVHAADAHEYLVNSYSVH
jgi:putative nucleotidyltransferase with HDIG domain